MTIECICEQTSGVVESRECEHAHDVRSEISKLRNVSFSIYE